MAGIKRDITRTHPELKEVVEMFERVSYRWNYSEVFDDLLDYMVRQHLSFPTEVSTEQENRFNKKYSDDEKSLFTSMLEKVVILTRERVNLWTTDKSVSGWYDPLGSFYEEVSGQGKKSAMGQFFTPPHIVTMMVQMTVGVQQADKIAAREPITLCEPACGSGRFILAANATHPGTFSCGNDLDQMCVKMTAINMCLNGAIGQVTCGDGLDIKGESFRFGWSVVPLAYAMECVQIPDENKKRVLDAWWKTWCMINPDTEKMYCMVPLQKEDCMIYSDPNISRTLHAENQQRSGASLKDRLSQLDFLAD